MRVRGWCGVLAVVGAHACARDGVDPVPPEVGLILPDGGVRLGVGPGCSPEVEPAWLYTRMYWELNGAEVPGDTAGPRDPTWRKGDALRCVVEWVHPGTGRVATSRSEEVIVGNTPPGAPAVSVSPELLIPRDQARCDAVAPVDPDGDPVTLRRSWWVDGVPSGDGEVLAGWFPPSGEVRCVVEATDGEASGPPAEDATVVADALIGGNVLLVLLDDVGLDRLAPPLGLGDGPATPTLNGLAEGGVVFRQAYAQPVCSPTRASILTGRAPHQHGIGSQTKYGFEGWSLQEAEDTLPEALRRAPVPYASGAVGKWHLDRRTGGGALSPLTVGGFDDFAGMDDNLLSEGEDGLPVDYFSWELNENGAYRRVETYNTTALADLAVDRMAGLPEPWFVYLALAAAHMPLHVPPEGLYHLDPGSEWTGSERLDAMIEAADTELGRVLDGMDPAVRARTTVIVTADNGTSTDMLGAPYPRGRGKGTIFEGGVRVPLVISGPGVAAPGREVMHLVQASDLFATVLDLAGLGPAPEMEATGGSVSLLHDLVDPDRGARRTWVAAERFEPLGLVGPYDFRDQMIRDDRFKLVRGQSGDRSLFDLSTDPYEAVDLLAGPDAAAWTVEADRLQGMLDAALAVP